MQQPPAFPMPALWGLSLFLLLGELPERFWQSVSVNVRICPYLSLYAHAHTINNLPVYPQ